METNVKTWIVKPDNFSGNEDISFDKKNNWNWDDLKTEFLGEFQPIGYLTLIKNKLETKRQNDLETFVMGFVAEVEHLCRQLDRNMKEEDFCVYILRGLKESVLNYISLHDNSNLKTLKII